MGIVKEVKGLADGGLRGFAISCKCKKTSLLVMNLEQF